jgi:hypothetical protein
MNLLKIFSEEQAKMPSVINDPFKKTKVRSLTVHCWQSSILDKKWSFGGTVKFENGNTSGEQSFTGKSFDDVVLQIKAMIDNLE